ncbi:MAG: substrate-binding domain-containing protein, partial [Candidatus Rokuibacteriota bacterium]
MKGLAVLGLLAVLLSIGAPVAAAPELTLSVAVSMKEAVEEIGRRFLEGRPGVTLRYNFGASGELQKQIEAGA